MNLAHLLYIQSNLIGNITLKIIRTRSATGNRIPESLKQEITMKMSKNCQSAMISFSNSKGKVTKWKYRSAILLKGELIDFLLCNCLRKEFRISEKTVLAF